MSEKVAVVTGANKGIGKSIVQGLAAKFDGIIYLTARNEELGLKALKDLEEKGVKARFHQLDIDNIESINKFAQFIKEQHGGLDILINNAGILIENKNPELLVKEAEENIRVNYKGTRNVCHAFFPLLRVNARVVNVVSRLGMLAFAKENEALRNTLTSESLTEEQIEPLIDQYLQAAKEGKEKQLVDNEFSSYSFSKMILIALTKVQQRLFDQTPERNILVSAVCPGYVATDLNNYSGYLTTEQGAETPIYLSLLPVDFDGPKGALWWENKTANWTDLTWKLF